MGRSSGRTVQTKHSIATLMLQDPLGSSTDLSTVVRVMGDHPLPHSTLYVYGDHLHPSHGVISWVTPWTPHL